MPLPLSLPPLLSSRRALSLLGAGTVLLVVLGLALTTADLHFSGARGGYRDEYRNRYAYDVDVDERLGLDGSGGWLGWKDRLGWGRPVSGPWGGDGHRWAEDLLDTDSQRDPVCMLLDSATALYRSSNTPTSTPGPTTFLPYTFGHAMLLQTLRAYAAARYPNLVVLDNSASGAAWRDRAELARRFGARVVRTPVRMRFAQLQAFMDALAGCEADEATESIFEDRRRGWPLETRKRPGHPGYYLWSHTDILLLSATPGHAYQRVQQAWAESSEEVLRGYAVDAPAKEFVPLDPGAVELEGMERPDSPIDRRAGGALAPRQEQKGLGIIFFQYDRLSAVSMRLRRDAPWDVAVSQYGADCDRYARVRLAGYTIVEGPGTVPIEENDKGTPDSGFRVVHVHGVLSDEELAQLYGAVGDDRGVGELRLPLDEAVAFIEAASERSEAYAWREDGVGEGGSEDGGGSVDRAAFGYADLLAANGEHDAGHMYMDNKWGEEWDCPLEGRRPAWDYRWD